MESEKRIPELIIVPSYLDRKIMRSNLKECYDCNSNLVYIEEQYGIVKEENDFGIME